jgi:ubiquinone/menaquinone biosynthesis C-methylase UbiE
MLKIYHASRHSGSTPDFWAEAWDEVDLETSIKLCDTDPLRPLFERYVNPDSLILEGGCGKGHWVSWFSNRGNKVVGLDFSVPTLSELNQNRPGLDLTAGNVNALPFADSTFDIYYSGGVVEHFEAGCDAALSEARRVIKPTGTLLLSVPFYSPLRRVLAPFRSGEWRKMTESAVDDAPPFEGLTYFQYLYGEKEFKRLLERNGLETIETMGYSVTWGLYDLKFLQRRGEARAAAASAAGTGPTAASSSDSANHSLIKHLVLDEATSSLLEKTVTTIMRSTCANMMMFVCRKR